MKKIQLSTDITNCLFGNYTIGSKDLKAVYKQNRGMMRVYLDIGSFNQNISKEELNKELSKYTILIND